MDGTAKEISATGCLVLIFPIAFLLAFIFVAWPVLLALVLLGVTLRLWQEYQWQQSIQKVNPFFQQLLKENQGAITVTDLALKANVSGTVAKHYLNSKAQEFGARPFEYADRGIVYYFITASTLGSLLDQSEPTSLEERKPAKLSTPITKIGETEPPTLEQVKQIASSTLVKIESNKPSVRTNNEPIRSSTLGKIFDDSEPDYAESNQLSQDYASPSQTEKQPLAESQSDQQQEVAKPIEPQVTPESLIQSELAKRLDVHSSTILKHRSERGFPEWSRSRDPEGIAWKYSPRKKLFFPQP